MRRSINLIFLLLISSQLYGQDKLNTIVNSVKERISISTYAQAGYTYNSKESPSNEFDLKRVSLTAVGKITERWTLLLMADLKQGKMQEFYTEYEFFSFLKAKFGQFKTAYTIENFIAPTEAPIISGGSQAVRYLTGADGSDIMFGANSGRDLGLLIHGRVLYGFLNYEIGIMNGQGINQSDRNSNKDIVGKLSFNIFDVFELSTSFIKGKGNSLVDNPDFTIEKGDNYRRNRWAIGGNFINPLLDLRSEYLIGKDGSIKSEGLYLTSNIHVMPKLDLIASFDYFNKNKSLRDRQSDYIGGLQYWFYPKCRLQAQYIFSDSKLNKNGSSVQFQVQIAF